MRSFPTLRDAEIAVGQLEDRLNKIEKKSGGGLSIDASSAGKIEGNVTEITQESIDSILTADGTKVIHRLWHLFQTMVQTRDFIVLPKAIPAVIGQILTATDVIGTTKWDNPPVIPPAPVFFSQQVDSTTAYSITTTFATIPGLVITLPTPGKYLLTASLVIGFTVNDSEIRGILIHNDSGGFVTVNGMIRLAKDAAAGQIISTQSKSWVITTTVVNVIAGIQIAKLPGTGTSISDLTNSTFTAAKVG
jgi:hypothetical protein